MHAVHVMKPAVAGVACETVLELLEMHTSAATAMQHAQGAAAACPAFCMYLESVAACCQGVMPCYTVTVLMHRV